MTAYRTAALTALGDPTRRSIFELLGRAPSTVGALADELPISRPAVSQHLKVLRTARLVTAEQHGTRNVYRIDPAGLTEIRQYLDRFWTLALASYAEQAGIQAGARSAARTGGQAVTPPDPSRSHPSAKEAPR